MTELTLVTGAGGFIGGQLVRDLSAKGVAVRAVDKKPVGDWYYRSAQAENLVVDLQLAASCDMRHQRRLTTSTISLPTWAAWASSRTTKRCACSRYSSTRIC